MGSGGHCWHLHRSSPTYYSLSSASIPTSTKCRDSQSQPSEGSSPAHSVLQLCTRSGPTVIGGKTQLGLQLSRTADAYTGRALDLCKAQEPHLLVPSPP